MTPDKDMFLLRALDSNLQGFTSTDKVLLLRKGTLAGGTLDLDLNLTLQPGAIVYYTPLIQAVVDDDGILGVANDMPGDTDEVLILVILDQRDYASAGRHFS